jgi:hypothetical protein
MRRGDIVYLNGVKLKVLDAPDVQRNPRSIGSMYYDSFSWVKCEVIEDKSGKYDVGYVSSFNSDFLRG